MSAARDIFINLDKLEIIQNDEMLVASEPTPPTTKTHTLKNKHFTVKWFHADAGPYIYEISTSYSTLMSGKLNDYEDNYTIVDDGTGEPMSIEEVFQFVFDS